MSSKPLGIDFMSTEYLPLVSNQHGILGGKDCFSVNCSLFLANVTCFNEHSYSCQYVVHAVFCATNVFHVP